MTSARQHYIGMLKRTRQFYDTFNMRNITSLRAYNTLILRALTCQPSGKKRAKSS